MSELLRRHQMAMLDLLNEVDRICQKNAISYQLFAGTALGAVRHHGFIPWDDDLDIVMLREDYEKFLVLAEGELGEQFYLQKAFSEHWPMFFTKLRLNHTTALEKYHVRDEKIHQGVYIDIFPCDNLSDHTLIRKIQFAASKVVIAKCLDQRGYETDRSAKKLFMKICRFLPEKPFYRLCILEKDKTSRMVHTFFGGTSQYEKGIYPREWFEENCRIRFEKKEYPVSAYVDKLLEKLYGDYMKIPAPDDRKCKTHVVVLDLERPYTEYLEMQKTLTFEGHSRSIR